MYKKAYSVYRICGMNFGACRNFHQAPHTYSSDE